MASEGFWLTAAIGMYFLAALAAASMAARGARAYRWPLGMLAAALGAHTAAIVLRWERVGHGPYVDLFEVLSSNVWSLHLAVLLACAFGPRIRPVLGAVLPPLQVPVAWLLTLSPADKAAPVTYNTAWLAVHVWFGKAFLGCLMVAVGLSLVVLLRRATRETLFAPMPASETLDEVAYRFVLAAFGFQGLMLVAGAIWAQDAWGRYWAWDPLETWAFITWIAVASWLHWRVASRPRPAVSAGLAVAIFVLAFATLFGMPFVTTAPHQGAV